MTDGGLQVELACEITFEVLRYEDVLAEPAVEFLDELLSSLVSRQVFFVAYPAAGAKISDCKSSFKASPLWKCSEDNGLSVPTPQQYPMASVLR